MNNFIEEAKQVNKEYKGLNIREINGAVVLEGSIHLCEGDEILDTYQLQIHASEKYPFSFPFVYETGGKLPINIDWHVYEDTGRCCIKIPPEEKLICKGGISLLGFLKNELVPYLFNQTFRRENGYYINERSHGTKGLIEFYGEKLSTRNVSVIIKLLGFIIYNTEPNRVARCFCGKHEKYRKCHREAFRFLSGISKEELLIHLRSIILFNNIT